MYTAALSLSGPTPLAERELQIQIQQALDKKLTGQIHIVFLDDRTETIFVHQGKVREIYIHNHRSPDLNWETPIKRFGRGALKIEPLPARAMMFKKVIVEEIEPGKTQNSGTNQLSSIFSLAEYNLTPTLFHIRWERAEGFILVAGKSIPICQAVLIAGDAFNDDPTALSQMLTWEEAQCKVTVYHGNIKNQAWLEVYLNILLEWYCRNILNNYKQLTGAVMVRSILQSLLVLAENKGWNITIQDQELKDTSMFLTAAETGKAYREMLSVIRLRIEPIIGSSLTHNMVKQSNQSAMGVYKVIQETFGLIEDAQ